MRIGINASSQLGTNGVQELGAHAAQCEADGFSSWWLAQIGPTDALAAIAVAAGATSTIEMGTAVVPTYTRHPSTMAGQALTAQSALGDRLVLGIGLSHQPVVEDRLLMEWQKPIGHMRDYLTIVNQVLSSGKANHEGKYFSFKSDGQRPTEAAPSVMLAALGPQMLKVAGTHSDGTILWMVGPKTIAEHIAPSINAAAEAAGRDKPRVVCSLPVAVTDDAEAAKGLHNAVFELYGQLPSYRSMLDREGAATPGDVCIQGNEDEVNAHLDALAEAGTTDFSAMELAASPEDMVRTRALLSTRAQR